eukprot:4625693-Pleurochrysis_carterae.AAC.2
MPCKHEAETLTTANDGGGDALQAAVDLREYRLRLSSVNSWALKGAHFIPRTPSLPKACIT